MSEGNGAAPVQAAKITKKLKIQRIIPPEHGAPGKLYFEGSYKIFKFWSWAKFAADLKVGDEAEAVIEQVASKNPQYPPDDFVTSWNGVTDRSPKGKGGGGGFRPQGKSETELLTSLAIAAHRDAVDTLRISTQVTPGMVDQVAEQYFNKMLAQIKGGKGAFGNA